MQLHWSWGIFRTKLINKWMIKEEQQNAQIKNKFRIRLRIRLRIGLRIRVRKESEWESNRIERIMLILAFPFPNEQVTLV